MQSHNTEYSVEHTRRNAVLSLHCWCWNYDRLAITGIINKFKVRIRKPRVYQQGAFGKFPV
jgi:hypothetical protein